MVSWHDWIDVPYESMVMSVNEALPIQEDTERVQPLNGDS